MDSPLPPPVGGTPQAPRSDADVLAEPMRSRWSPSIFDPERELSGDEIATLLQAARWSASYGNSQPWQFVVAARGGTAHGLLVRHLSRGNSGWVPKAPVVIINLAWIGSDLGADYACYDLGQAVAHLTLQAHAMGLHAHQFAGFDRVAVAEELGVPADYRILSGVAVGRRGAPESGSARDQERDRRVRERTSLEDFVHADAWGTPWRPSP